MPNIDTSTPVPLLPEVAPYYTDPVAENLHDLNGDREAAHRDEFGTVPDLTRTANQPINWAGQQAPSEFDPNLIEYPPIPVLEHTEVHERPEDLFHDGHLETQYVNPQPLKETVGIPSILTTALDVTNDLAVAAVSATELLYQGAGIMVGVTIVSVAFATTWIGISDSIDGNGPILALMNAAVAQTGYISFGLHGIRFTNGLTVVNNLGNKLEVIPIIKTMQPVNP